MLKALVLVVPVVLAIFCLVQIAQARHQRVRVLPRWAWTVAVVLFPLVGSVAWLVFGRPQDDRPAPPRPQRRIVAPDDDPDFLRRLRNNPPDEPR